MNTEAPLDSQIRNLVAYANTLGHSVLIETLKMAAYYLNHSNGTIQTKVFQFTEAKSCYMFVQGTGLNALINHFGMDYDPETLRDGFNYCVRRSA